MVEIYEFSFNILPFPVLSGVLYGLLERFFGGICVIYTEMEPCQIVVSLCIPGGEFNRFLICGNCSFNLFFGGVEFRETDIMDTTFRVSVNISPRQFKGFTNITR